MGFVASVAGPPSGLQFTQNRCADIAGFIWSALWRVGEKGQIVTSLQTRIGKAQSLKLERQIFGIVRIRVSVREVNVRIHQRACD
jgi:hypothetical protein